MEEKEDKGFVLKDRRKISLEDTEPEGAAPEGGEQAVKEEAAEGTRDETSREREGIPQSLPEVTFSTLVFSFSSSALVHLGEIPEPGTQETNVDLALAKQVIDTLGLLQDKTKGNLDKEEEQLLRSVLYDLRLRYIQKSGR